MLHLASVRYNEEEAMTITLPPEIERTISQEEAALHLAIGLFADDKVTLGQAASIAGISQSAMLHELGRRRIPVHYGIEEFEQDLATIKQWPTNSQ